MKSGNGLLGIVAVVAIVLFFVMTASGPGSRLSNGWSYLTTGSTTLQSGQPQALANGATDYRAMARQDAIDNGIDPDLFERQINQESGFNPKAISPMGAEGIAQIMPSTAKSWNVDPWNPVASLSVAADHMHWYYQHYGNDYSKALSCYNAGTDALDTAMARYGSNWRIGLPAETQRYIALVMGD